MITSGLYALSKDRRNSYALYIYLFQSQDIDDFLFFKGPASEGKNETDFECFSLNY